MPSDGVPFPELRHAKIWTTRRIVGVDNTRQLVYHTGFFRSDMNDEGITNIIRELVRSAHCSVLQYTMSEAGTSGVVFEAGFSEWVDQSRAPSDFPAVVATAKRVLALGWDALAFLPHVWQVKTIWDFIDDVTVNPALQSFLFVDAFFMVYASGEEPISRATASAYRQRPELKISVDIFRSRFPDVGLLMHALPCALGLP